jgi:hypothetical protein
LISNGKKACAELRSGYTLADISRQFSSGTYLTFEQAAFEVGAAVGAYCPDQRSKIDHP